MAVHRLAVVTAFATFCLLIAGGLVSTTESGLACPDWPLCEGKVFPKMVDGKQFEHTHRLVASAVATLTFVLCAVIFRQRRADRVLTRLGAGAAVLGTGKPALRILVTLAAVAVLAQVALGIATILTSRELVTMTLHSSLGAALLASLVGAYWIACPSALPTQSSVRVQHQTPALLETV